MGATEYVELARAASRRGDLVLRQRREEHRPPVLELRANGVFVMDSHETSTERALATAALGLVDDPRRVLVGGLGLGYTMHEILTDPRVHRCTVVELEPDLVAWMTDGTIPHGPGFLADPRIEMVVDDVARVLGSTAPASYDLVLLDVDNGPGHLVHDANAALYEPRLLAAVREALRPGGGLVLWSADQAPDLLHAMDEAFDVVRAQSHEVDLQGRREQYWLYLGRRARQP